MLDVVANLTAAQEHYGLFSCADDAAFAKDALARGFAKVCALALAMAMSE